MRIFRLKEDWTFDYCIYRKFKKGTRFFEEIKDGIKYYHSGSYPLREWDDFKFVDEMFELIGETKYDKDYFFMPRYTQEQVDKMLKVDDGDTY